MSVGELFVLIDRAFHAGSTGCKSCLTPLPVFRRDTPDDPANANWTLAPVIECPTGCRERLVKIALDLQAQFELVRKTSPG